MNTPTPENDLIAPRWAHWLDQPNALWFLVALGVLVGLPSIGLGIVADDLIHRLILLGIWPFTTDPDPLMHMFSFIPGNTLGTEPLREMGILSWLADPDISATFFRPVTALTHVIDYQLWPDHYWLQHLHSLAWYGASCGAAYLCLRRFGLALPLAALAGLMFTLEEAHGLNMGWLANRNASICLVFGIASICLHHRWRQEGKWIFITASVLCFGLAMLAAEAGVGALAYIAAWELVMEDKGWRRRALGLLPYGLALLAWLLMYKHLGYGVQWSDVYVDPGTQPVRFLLASLERLPMMVAAQWLQAPIDISNALDLEGRIALSGFCWLITGLLLRWLWSLLRARQEARFWALGMFLSFIPLCAAFPMVRVLTFSGLGAFALIAMKVGDWVTGDAEPSRFQRILLFLHIPFSGVYLVATPFIWFGILSPLMPTHQLPKDLNPKQTMVIMQSHAISGASLSLMPMIEGWADAPIPIAMLGPILMDIEVRRIAPKALELRVEQGWGHVPVERLTRSIERPWRVGDLVVQPRYTVEIKEVTDDGRPRVAWFTFDRPLEDPSLRWFIYEGLNFVEWDPPQGHKIIKLKSVSSGFF